MLEKSDLCRSQLSLRESPLIWTTTSSPLGGRPVKGQDVHMRTCHIDRCFSHLFFLLSHFLYKILLSYLNGDCRADAFRDGMCFPPIPSGQFEASTIWVLSNTSVTTPGDILNGVCLIKGNNRWRRKANVQRVVHLFTFTCFLAP